MKNMKINKKILLLAAMLIIATFAAYLLVIRNKDSSKTLLPGQVDYSEATAEERQAAEDNKKRLTEEETKQQNEPERQPGDKKSVQPVITLAEQYDSQVELSGFIPGVFEDDGVCTGIMTKDSLRLNRTVKGVKEGNAVFCPLMKFNISEFSLKGTWKLVIQYESSSASGMSESQNMEVK